MIDKLFVFGNRFHVVPAGLMPVNIGPLRHQAVMRDYGVAVKIGYDHIGVPDDEPPAGNAGDHK